MTPPASARTGSGREPCSIPGPPALAMDRRRIERSANMRPQRRPCPVPIVTATTGPSLGRMTPHLISPVIDARTGKITFDEPSITIDPSLTRDAFLGSPIAAGATTHNENEPYHSWKLGGTFRSSGLDLLVVLWFHRRRLTMVSLMDSDPRFGTSWEDSTVEKEMAR